MYYATGLPGWMRFGYSPGWIGRSPTGLGPCAQFLLSGEWPAPQMQQAWQGVQPAGFDRLTLLKDQAAMLQQQLDTINSQIAELEKE
jgi:hypothetical protein